MEEDLRRKEEKIRQHEANRLALERLKRDLTKAIQGINEANERAVLLGRNVHFRPEILRQSDGVSGGMASAKVVVKVQYPDISDDIKIHWNLDKLEERLVDMQEICTQLQYGARMDEIQLGYDPFSDEVDAVADTR